MLLVWRREPTMSTRSHSRWRESIWTRARAVASLGMVFGLGAVGTMAYWTDTATMTTGTFSVGASLDLQVNGSKSYNWPLTASGMMPGDTVASTLIVQNKGGVTFNYTAKVNSSGDHALAPYMTLKAFSGASVSANKCTNGTAIGSATLQVGSARDLVTSARPLSVEGAETLCFEAQLSNAVSKTVSNQAVKAIVEFTATE
ncbi:TasA family protein [Dietzia sp. NPDC055343]